VVNPDEIAEEWCALQACTDCSYFQSWGWVGVWLRRIAADFKPQVVRVRHRDSLVGLGIFVHRDIRRRLFINSNAMFLNEYPFNGRNMALEYNGLLAHPDHWQAVYTEVIQHLFGTDAGLDEVFFGAIDVDAVALQDLLHPVCQQAQISQQLLEESYTWAVDLDSIGSGMKAYLDTLSKNRRAQVRRSFRLYEASGPLHLEQAKDLDTALGFFPS
jgi:CelD/BcsL family acetyltransferase involved in cellulose biosynthesis